MTSYVEEKQRDERRIAQTETNRKKVEQDLA